MALLTTSCTDTASAPENDTATEPPVTDTIPEDDNPTAAEPREVAAAEAVEAYEGMWSAMAEAGETSDWRSPVLAEFATGEALSAISRGMYADHRNGVVTRGGGPELAPEVDSAEPPEDPTTVVIADCGDSSGWLKYFEESGEPVDDEPGGRQAITAEVRVQEDGAWRVVRFAVQGVGSC
ncbi:hypothetical protein [Streptomyces sp. SBT349]|uniref:hypothetical protein n=1 Tax=Streptomyces sp. SBT349 TaxID=1580539 RepID=UPI0018FEE92D|nr:hypothetical protein [Streptomyces sp. SBT349]